MTASEYKKLRGAPCTYQHYSEIRKRMEILTPAVDCSMDCDTCGFNPWEQSRRLEEGHFVKRGRVKKLIFKPYKDVV